MSMRSGAVHYLAVLCFLMVVLMAIGSVAVDACERLLESQFPMHGYDSWYVCLCVVFLTKSFILSLSQIASHRIHDHHDRVLVALTRIILLVVDVCSVDVWSTSSERWNYRRQAWLMDCVDRMHTHPTYHPVWALYFLNIILMRIMFYIY